MSRGELGGPGLYGRRSECDRLERMLAEIRTGRSQVLVLRGDAGIGKTALLDHMSRHASGCRVARVTGVESEMELAFAGLHQLCAPFLDRLGRLPPPQRDALSMVFGLREGNTPDRFFIGLAVLSLLSDAAEERPLVCLVDDAQWLDQASAHTLAFVARRLQAESVALVFATRESGDDPALRQLPELRVQGLSDVVARAVLRAALRRPLDPAVLDGIVAEARGNPLALLELPRGRTPAEISFGFGLSSTLPLGSRLEQGFVRQLQPLPPETRRLLLLAAVEPVGDVISLWEAAKRLGIAADAATSAEAAGLIDIGSRVRFRHPLLRSAVFRAADVSELRDVHAALAAAPDLDPDRRAWHRAQASPGPDEEIAAELDRSADRARARGGLAAAAAFRERAATLTPDPARRVTRALAAAQAKLQAGEFGPASELVLTAESGPLDDLLRARIALLRAQIAFAAERTDEAPQLLLSAAARLEGLDVALAHETYLDAFSAAIFVGRLTGDPGLREIARAVRRAPAHRHDKRDLILDGLAALFTEGYAAAVPLRQRAVQAFLSEYISADDEPRLLWIAASAAANLWDDEGWNVLSARHVRVTRDTGALSELPLALSSQIVALLLDGKLATAAALIEEMRAVREATGSNIAPYGALVHAALRGREAPARELIDTTLKEVLQRGEGNGAMNAHWAAAVLLNGLGRHEEALASARRASEYPLEFVPANWGLVELIEAAVRTSDNRVAGDAFERLSETTGAAGTDWSLGVESRSRALLGAGDADELYRQAIDRLGRTRVKVELARTHLLYGEWLRREGRRIDARRHLRAAHDQFTSMGAEGFGERARRELAATGETVRTRVPAAREELTAQETEIARLAALGRTNQQIGAQLFISPRTVEWHLGKVFMKLRVSSRKELYDALPEDVRVSVPC
ncbi:AAA family ATPase [Pseudonocardia sp. CA-142604]|uniref:helix-turn-helix transcriptional regulator n=1 Tax=Pseudonocardia sp. CA-142604 TaxID=3240024 RepID=UPI003D92B6E4